MFNKPFNIHVIPEHSCVHIAFRVSPNFVINHVFEIRDLWPESAIDTGVLTNRYIIKFAYWFEKFIYKRAKMINDCILCITHTD